MSTAAPDFSSLGAIPAGTPPPPQQQPAPQQAASTAAPDFSSLGAVQASPSDPGLLSQAGSSLLAFGKGMLQGGAGTVAGLGNMVAKVAPGLESDSDIAERQKWNDFASAPAADGHGTAQTVGKTAEGMLEFLMGDEALKGLSYADKLQKVLPAMKVMEKSPILREALGKFMQVGARQGTVGAAQAAVHGASPGDSVLAGLMSGVTGGALEGAGSAISGTIKSVKPGTLPLGGGEEVSALRSQMPGASPAARFAANIGSEPELQATQQTAGKTRLSNVAKQAAEDSIERFNQAKGTRAPYLDPSRLLAPPAVEIPTELNEVLHGQQPSQQIIAPSEAVEGTASADTSQAPEPVTGGTYPAREVIGGPTRIPSPPRDARLPERYSYERRPFSGTDYVGSGEGGEQPALSPTTVKGQSAATMKVTTPEQAHRMLYGTAEDRNGLVNADFSGLDAQAQGKAKTFIQQLKAMADIGSDAQRPGGANFQPVDATAAASRVSHFGHAVDEIQAAASPVYQKLDEVSGGRFTRINGQIKKANAILRNPSTMDAADAAEARLAEAHGEMDDLFEEHRDSIEPADYRAARSAWRDSKILDGLHTTLERGFSPVPEDVAARTGLSRTIDGSKLMGRMKALEDKGGIGKNIPDIERVIGQQGRDSIYRVGSLLTDPDTKAATQNVAKEVATHLSRRGKGAIVGGVLGAIVGHPAIGAFSGAGLEDASRALLHHSALTPNVSKSLEYAVRNNVASKIAVPLLASSISQSVNQ